MPRRRLAVALIPPPALAGTIDTLRRAVGVPEPFTVPPHLTLVSPVNVREDDLPRVLASLRAAAIDTAPFQVRVGPAATFAPDSPTLHLSVTGAVPTLGRLRERLLRGPMDRPDTWPYVPHVTLAESFPADRIAAGVATLAAVDEAWTVDRLHLLEERRDDDGRRWEPVVEEPLGPAAVVGRGGVELSIRVLGMLEARAAALGALAPAGPALDAGSARPLVVVAEAGAGPGPGPAVGVAGGVTSGGTARLDVLAVAEDRRGVGIGRQVLAAWCSAAAERDCSVVLVEGEVPEAGRTFAQHHGFVPAARALVRTLG